MEQEKFKNYYAGYSKEGPTGKIAGSRLMREEGSNSPGGGNYYSLGA